MEFVILQEICGQEAINEINMKNTIFHSLLPFQFYFFVLSICEWIFYFLLNKGDEVICEEFSV
jgi:hypothetical protein